MVHVLNAPEDFVEEVVTGFVAANSPRVRRVSGGVVRRDSPVAEKTAVVIGGGSGHYPAFIGLVGPGLADGAVTGNVFASPSARQVESVARAVHSGRGVLLTYGNYAGDVLNFDAAEHALRGEGLDVRTVRVTDDVSSAPRDQRELRRGVAGDLVVFKIAGALAEAGGALDEVERVAIRANDRTRTFGVAFGGCTLPGAEEPLFSLPAGTMGLGMGIHGEPGLAEVEIPDAAELARMLVERLVDERPDDVESPAGCRVVPLLNGLGTVKHEELFLLYGAVARELESAGLTIVDPQVGEFCTSFDMAGLSLTILWLDDELEGLWAAPADSVAFRTAALVGAATTATVAAEHEEEETVPPAGEDSVRAAAVALAGLEAVRQAIDAAAGELGRIDAVAGDGDHGIGMQRGTAAAVEAARETAARGAGAGTVLVRAGEAWADRAGGTSGALWGLMLRTLGGRVGDAAPVTGSSLAEGVAAAAEALTAVGGAQPGDKTMVDAVEPFVGVLAAAVAAGASLAAAWKAAAAASTEAAIATADLLPRRGRARPHAERSLGTPDAGAVSFALAVTAVAAVIDDEEKGKR